MEYFRFWGKADEKNGTWHPLVYHSLDVAAAACEILRVQPVYRRKLLQGLSLADEALDDFVGFIAAVHDLGKFAGPFQIKVPQLFYLLQPEAPEPPVGPNHSDAGFLFWNRAGYALLAERLGNEKDSFKTKKALRALISASAGHHGSPPRSEGGELSVQFRGAIPAVRSFLNELFALFPGFIAAFKRADTVAAASTWPDASWTFSGLLIMADWLGSHTGHFPHFVRHFELPSYFEPLPDYFKQSEAKAKLALREQRLIPAVPDDLFSLQQIINASPTDMQRSALEITLPKEPSLYILEDATGSGKTEAAILLAHRLMLRGEGDGIYFALPTMATSNGMYRRIAPFYRKLYIDGSEPSLVLAHGSSGLHQEYQDSILSHRPLEEDAYEEGVLPSGALCAEWIADKSKKAFLAQVGVGSIDQALLSVLYSRHHTLRLFGLALRILVVDEVHAYDSYMLELLEKLLKLQARAGASVILLSATLPQATKRKLAAAYCSAAVLKDTPEPYPSLSYIVNEEVQTLPVRARQRRGTQVHFVHSLEEVADFLAQTALSGQCAAWIRNTVRDVQDGFDLLTERIPAENLLLFHARFTAADRARIESNVLDDFGRDSGPDDRAGRVLIASQVVEQSLDLDFDFMIVDLCPIDLIIQRLGRLQRHARDKSGALLPSGKPDQRTPSALYVFGPDPVKDPLADWYSSFFRGGAFVYPDSGKLWRTARILKERKEIVVPDAARELIEGVYGDESDLPPALLAATRKALMEAKEARSKAGVVSIEPDDGYLRDFDRDPYDEKRAPTRLEDRPVFNYRLCLEKGEILVPLEQESPLPWQMSELKSREIRHLDRSSRMSDLIAKANFKLFDKGRGGILLPVVPDGPDCFRVLDTEKWHYDRRIGLIEGFASQK